jgi:hypothetical protein
MLLEFDQSWLEHLHEPTGTVKAMRDERRKLLKDSLRT